MFFDPETFEGIEIYRSSSELPDELLSGLRILDLWPMGWPQMCGVAWIWTRAGW
jgi:hypothetical protein